MTASRGLDAKEYNATKQAVRQLKLQVTAGNDKATRDEVDATMSCRFSKCLQTCQHEMEAALAEHTVIVRTSGIRPGRENILVEHVEAIRVAHAQGLAKVAEAYKSMDLQWKAQRHNDNLSHQVELETLALQLAEREKDMDQSQQKMETQHFEELERLTHTFDDKVVEIQKLCNDKIAHTNETCEATIAAVRTKMKAWKHAFEIKVKDAVHAKIEHLKVQSEHELKVVMTQLDKEVHALKVALHESRQHAKEVEGHVCELTKQLQLAKENQDSAAERFLELEQQLAHERAQVSHLRHVNKEIDQTCQNQRQIHEEEKRRLAELQAAAQTRAEQQIQLRHEQELEKLHDRVRQAIATKSDIITRLETQVADALSRAESSEAVLMQLNSDIQSCGSLSQAPCKEAFQLNLS
ncbi:hypothetical protein H310_06018 [Aphanomyces invadans]|uniref:Protein FAM184A/B N-terminal domain-containing protein n=1 Tax=Aphanomyces invadans TaxID=157072 RepID=A0A024U8D8_9STRA|nr:hypothetical protein H310_06018 [Aphanomyces invadans]ETW02529.1 hypothetical protein H310_06018 [Aphanomyces invadans]|eukprot:XP_008869134.1 hypothetical protein H310_06018 [Aphanomyces invadans]